MQNKLNLSIAMRISERESLRNAYLFKLHTVVKCLCTTDTCCDCKDRKLLALVGNLKSKRIGIVKHLRACMGKKWTVYLVLIPSQCSSRLDCEIQVHQCDVQIWCTDAGAIHPEQSRLLRMSLQPTGKQQKRGVVLHTCHAFLRGWRLEKWSAWWHLFSVSITSRNAVCRGICPSVNLEKTGSWHSLSYLSLLKKQDGAKWELCISFDWVTHLMASHRSTKRMENEAGWDPAALGIPENLRIILKAAWAGVQACESTV